jgi:arabinan endo-1,5-alpha-L-arabinosidase
MVARANNAFGPFERLGEARGTGSSVILEKDSIWVAPGHNSIFKDNKGNTWMAYHAIRRDSSKADKPAGSDHYTKRVFCIEPVQYKNGWPVVLHTY